MIIVFKIVDFIIVHIIMQINVHNLLEMMVLVNGLVIFINHHQHQKHVYKIVANIMLN